MQRVSKKVCRILETAGIPRCDFDRGARRQVCRTLQRPRLQRHLGNPMCEYLEHVEAEKIQREQEQRDREHAEWLEAENQAYLDEKYEELYL